MNTLPKELINMVNDYIPEKKIQDHVQDFNERFPWHKNFKDYKIIEEGRGSTLYRLDIGMICFLIKKLNTKSELEDLFDFFIAPRLCLGFAYETLHVNANMAFTHKWDGWYKDIVSHMKYSLNILQMTRPEREAFGFLCDKYEKQA